MFESRRGDHAVGSAERRSSQLALPVQHAPAIGDGMSHWQNTSMKPRQQFIFKPLFQVSSPLARRERDESTTQFADRYNAQV